MGCCIPYHNLPSFTVRLHALLTFFPSLTQRSCFQADGGDVMTCDARGEMTKELGWDQCWRTLPQSPSAIRSEVNTNSRPNSTMSLSYSSEMQILSFFVYQKKEKKFIYLAF